MRPTTAKHEFHMRKWTGNEMKNHFSNIPLHPWLPGPLYASRGPNHCQGLGELQSWSVFHHSSICTPLSRSRVDFKCAPYPFCKRYPATHNSPGIPIGTTSPLPSITLALTWGWTLPTVSVLWSSVSAGVVWKETGLRRTTVSKFMARLQWRCT